MMAISFAKRLEAFKNKEVCGWCEPEEDNKNGEIKPEWFEELRIYIPTCRKHSIELSCPHSGCRWNTKKVNDDFCNYHRNWLDQIIKAEGREGE